MVVPYATLFEETALAHASRRRCAKGLLLTSCFERQGQAGFQYLEFATLFPLKRARLAAHLTVLAYASRFLLGTL